MRLLYLFVSKKIPNFSKKQTHYLNAVTLQSSLVLNTKHIEHNQALWHLSIVWCLFGHKHQNLTRYKLLVWDSRILSFL